MGNAHGWQWSDRPLREQERTMTQYPVTMTDEQYRLLLDAIDTACQDLNDKIYEREQDYSADDRADMMEKQTELENLAEWLKISTGNAYEFQDHFTMILDQDGEPVMPKYPAGTQLDNATFHHVWTVLDVDGRLYVSPGLHYVNRMNYILTKERWTEDDEKKEWIY